MEKKTSKAKAGKAKVSEEKLKTVKEFENLIKKYPIVASLNMENLPAKQLQNMRSSMRGFAVIKMTKRRLMKIAVEICREGKKGIEQLLPYLKGMPALLFTNENPFRLYNVIKKSKSTAPAKAGQTAPKDIAVKAGPTPFAPGPIIGELGQAGIKAGIEGGKVAIKQDVVVVREGQAIKPNIASILARLGIEPMEIGLDVTAVYENGVVYTKEVLAIDEEAFAQKINEASTYAFNLAMESAYTVKDTILLLLARAFNDSKALALDADIMADALIVELLAKAEGQAKACSSLIEQK